MIQILSRTRASFKNPDLHFVKPPEDPNKIVMSGGSDVVMSSKYEEVYWTVPALNTVVSAPDWIKSDPLFAMCVKDGTLMEIKVQAGERVSDAAKVALDQQNNANRESVEKAAEALAEYGRTLESMSKADLIDHARDEHGMDLSPAMKKDDMIAAITNEKAQKANTEPSPTADIKG